VSKQAAAATNANEYEQEEGRATYGGIARVRESYSPQHGRIAKVAIMGKSMNT